MGRGACVARFDIGLVDLDGPLMDEALLAGPIARTRDDTFDISFDREPGD